MVYVGYSLPLFFYFGFVLGYHDMPKMCPLYVSRAEWRGRNSVFEAYSIPPVKMAIIHHTATLQCYNKEICSAQVRRIQKYHMDKLNFSDIGYNFLVGSDDKIYEGAGWHKIGSHTEGYNHNSLGIAFIGNFSGWRYFHFFLFEWYMCQSIIVETEKLF